MLKWIKRGADINAGVVCCCWSWCSAGWILLIFFFLFKGEKVPIVVAIRSGNAKLVKFLAENGARLGADLPVSYLLFLF